MSEHDSVGAVSSRVRTELRHRWLAWGTTALLVGMAGGVVLTMAAGARRTDTAFSRYLAGSHAADELVSPNERGFGGFYAALRAVPGAGAVAPLVGVAGFRPGEPANEVQVLLGTDAQLGRTIERPELVEGRLPNPARADEVVADAAVASRDHVHAGSRMRLELLTALGPADVAHALRITLHVVGIGVTRNDIVPVNQLASQPTVIGTPALWHRLGATYEGYDGAFVRLDPGASRSAFERHANALTARFPQTGGGVFIADYGDQNQQVDNAIHPQAVALALFAVFVGIVALFVIGQIIARQISLAASDNPTLRALGMDRRQLLAIGLTEAAAVAVVGAVLAVVIAIAASPLMPIGPARVAEPAKGIDIDVLVLGIGFLAIPLLLLACAAWTAWRAAGTPGSTPALDRGSQRRTARISAAAAKLGIPPTGAIGMRFAFEPGRGRTAVPVRSALAGTVIAVAAVVGALTFGASLNHLVETPRLYGQTWDASFDVQFGSLPRHRTDALLEREPGVDGWTYGTHDELTIDGHRVTGIELARAHGSLLAPTLLAGRAAASPKEIVLGAKSLDLVGKDIGQTVTVRSIAGASTTKRIVGTGVFPYFGEGGFTPSGLGTGAQSGSRALDHPNFVLVHVAPGPNHDAHVTRVLRDAQRAGLCDSDQQCLRLREQRPSDIINYARIQQTPIVLGALLAALAMAIFAHVLLTSIRRRRRDIAILKTLGFARLQVSTAVSWQATALVVVALAVGLPLGIVAGRFAWTSFADALGATTTPSVPVGTLVLALPIGLLVANAIAAIPGIVAGRQRPAPVLRSE
jgi:ABC-type lipoprotein release transport system permease subunit